MIEWYRLGFDYHALMDDVERLLRRLFEGQVEPAASRRVSYRAAFEAGLGLDPLGCPLAALAGGSTARGMDVPPACCSNATRCSTSAVGTRRPCVSGRSHYLLYDFPASQAALARIDGHVAARFEAFWGGLELANGFDELGRGRRAGATFDADRRSARGAAAPDHEPDQAFLAALAAGLPRCSGVALGFDRPSWSRPARTLSMTYWPSLLNAPEGGLRHE